MDEQLGINSVPQTQTIKSQTLGATAPIVVLVHPQLGENIGMAARAMVNCGVSQLRLVAPRDGWDTIKEAAQSASAGAELIIETVEIYETLAEAVADCGLVLAATGRHHDIVKPLMTPETSAQMLCAYTRQASPSSLKPAAFLFGCERSGLTNEQLTHADAMVTAPLNPEYNSLNLSQAVLLMCYAWWHHAQAQNDAKTRPQDVDHVDLSQIVDGLQLNGDAVATKAEIEILTQHWIAALDKAQFFSTPEKRPLMIRNLRNTFQRMRLSQQETRSFHGMLKAMTGVKDFRDTDLS